MSDADARVIESFESPPRVVDDEARGLAAVRQIDLTRLPPGTSLRLDILSTSTGRYRLRACVGTEKARQEIGDRVMTFDDLVLDLQVFVGENLAIAVRRAQDAGAGIQL